MNPDSSDNFRDSTSVLTGEAESLIDSCPELGFAHAKNIILSFALLPGLGQIGFQKEVQVLR